MLSPEFNSALKSGNLLRTRIMLKDSLIVDPTFTQFNEMLAYARRDLPGVVVPHDGEALENDRSKWTKDLMNMELVEIVNNFSDVRIEHLKKIIEVILADKIKSAATVRTNTHPTQPQRVPQGRNYGVQQPYGRNISPEEIELQKRTARKQALSQITNSSKKIESVMSAVKAKGSWHMNDIRELEDAATQILSAARNYKNNK